jgi:hypothetical protein
MPPLRVPDRVPSRSGACCGSVLTAGTRSQSRLGPLLHRTRTPLQLGFWAAYLMTTATPGIPGSKLQRQLGLGR